MTTTNKLIVITGKSMSYVEWRKYLKPLVKWGKLRNIYFTQNYFFDLPKGKYWCYEKRQKATFCGIPATDLIVDSNHFQ